VGCCEATPAASDFWVRKTLENRYFSDPATRVNCGHLEKPRSIDAASREALQQQAFPSLWLAEWAFFEAPLHYQN
jgi:hypothetical protein